MATLAFDNAPAPAALEALRRESAPSVLVFYPDCFMARSNGSHARVVSLIQHLVDSGTDVTVYSYHGSGGAPWTPRDVDAFGACYPGARLLLEDESLGLKLAKVAKKTLIQLFPGANTAILSKGAPGCAPKLSQWKREHPNGAFVINYVDNVSRINGVEPSHTIVETHDFQYFRRSKGAPGMLSSVMGLLRLRHEVATLSGVGGVVAISRTEEYVYRNLAPQSRIFFVPLYDQVQAPVHSLTHGEYQYDLLFVGSSNKVNELGLLQCVESCPWLRQYRIAVCGKICELESIRKLASNENNLKLLGFQDDLSVVYQSAKACICPTQGTGLNIKILEALSYGRTVFASRDAMDALPGGFEGCVFPLDSMKIATLLATAAGLEAAAKAAKEYYRSIPEAGDVGSLDAHLVQLSAHGLLEAYT